MRYRKSILLGLVGVLLVVTGLASQSTAPRQHFLLFGTAEGDLDPENPANEVLSIVNPTGPPFFGLAFRDLRVKIETLDNQLQFKYFYPSRTCGGGSPRITLLIDSNGDGRRDFAAHGHVNPNPPSPFTPFTDCPMGEWRFEDLTDDQERWEVTPGGALGVNVCAPIGGATDCTWDQLETAVATTFPNHQVLSGFLVEDSGGFFGAAAGLGFYDNVTIGNGTIQNHADTARNPGQPPL